MNNFKYKVRQFMQGRYGIDELGKALFAAGMILYVIGMITRVQFLLSVELAFSVYFVYRALSKNIWKRQRENNKFLSYKKLWKIRYKERKTSRIFICKECGKFIRVPKGKGKIEVRCRVCGCTSIRRS